MVDDHPIPLDTLYFRARELFSHSGNVGQPCPPRNGSGWATLSTSVGSSIRGYSAMTCERDSPFISNVMPFMLTVPPVLSSISLPTSRRVR